MSRVETIKHVDGVRARWLSAHADPTVNPAWANAERDIGLLLQDYDELAAELARCRAANVYDGAAHKRVADLEAALREIAKAEGAFSRDPLEHAGNCIQSMRDLAREALTKAETIQSVCACEFDECRKQELKSDQYCHNDRKAAALETPVSTLCAICDQIKELHPATHEWTAKETKGDASGT